MLPDLPVYSFTPDLGGLLSLTLTIVLPLLVGVVTTRVTSANIKAVILLALATVKTLVEAIIAANVAGIPFEFVPVLMNLVLNFVVAVVVYFGLWKPTGTAQVVQENVGITSTRRY